MKLVSSRPVRQARRPARRPGDLLSPMPTGPDLQARQRALVTRQRELIAGAQALGLDTAQLRAQLEQLLRIRVPSR